MVIRRLQLVTLARAAAARQACIRQQGVFSHSSPLPATTTRTMQTAGHLPPALRSFSSAPASANDVDEHQQERHHLQQQQQEDDEDNNIANILRPDFEGMDACPMWLKKVQTKPPTSYTYFEVFGLEPQYSLSLTKLQQLYKKLMIQYHPDKHHGSTVEQQDGSDEKSAIITRAYETLRDPQSRALHLLEVLGHPLEESAKSQLVGQDFLMEVMEVREEILDHQHHDNDDEVASLRRLWDANQRRIQALTQELAQAFDQQQPPNVDAALRLTAQLQYWYRVEEKLLETMDEIPESR